MKRTISQVIILIITTLMGGILGFGLQLLQAKGFNRPWHEIENLPGLVTHILAINGTNIWLQTNSGIVHYNASPMCETNCLQIVDQVPASYSTPLGATITDQLCGWPPPLLGIKAIETQSQCVSSVFVDFGVRYVLHQDGKLSIWSNTFSGEWFPVECAIWTAGGAILFFSAYFLLFMLFSISGTIRPKFSSKKVTPQT